MIRGVLAHCTVTNLDRAEDWYTRLFDREPDARPMPGLLEWQLGDAFGIQIWSETDRAGHSSVVLDETNLDATAARLAVLDSTTAAPTPAAAPESCSSTIPTATVWSSPEPEGDAASHEAHFVLTQEAC